MDFYATALDFAGVKSSHTHFGRSLRRNLKEHGYQNRKFATSEGGRIPEEIHCDEYHASGAGDPTTEEYYPKKMAQADAEAHAKGFMMRGERFKYVSRYNRADELYDMQTDPHERHNLIDDPAYKALVAQMKEDMLYWLEETSDIVPFEFDTRFNTKGIVAMMKKNMTPAQYQTAEEAVEKGVIFKSFGELFAYLGRR